MTGFDCRGRLTNAACLRRCLPGNLNRRRQRKLRPASCDQPCRGRSGGNPLGVPAGPIANARTRGDWLAVATEWERGTAFLFAPVLLAAGAFAYFVANREPSLGSIVASVAAAAALTFVSRSRLALHLAFAALLCLALGTLFAKIETMRAATKVLGGEISTRLTGRVAVIERQDDGRIRMTIDVLGTERPKLRYAPQRVRVSARSVPDGLLAGDVVSGVARLGPPTGPTRPDGYDFSFNSYFNGIGANGFFLTGPERTAGAFPATPAIRFLALVENLRTALADQSALRSAARRVRSPRPWLPASGEVSRKTSTNC